MTVPVSGAPLRIAIVAGEASGDILGAGLIRALKAKHPDAIFEGIGGPLMIAEGFQTRHPMERLSVMGLVEVLGRIFELLSIRKDLSQHYINNPPDVFIGIDAPDFNLTLEEKLKQQQIKTVHYVSPSVWAWRKKRVFKIARATNRVLALLPFEKAFYDEHQVPCTFVGHSLADDIPLVSDKQAARQQLGIDPNAKLLALMPGSRGGELAKLSAPFLQAALALKNRVSDSNLVFIVPMISDKRAEQFKRLQAEFAPDLPITVVVNQTQAVMSASDCLLMASGTVTLEAALIKRPMVVCYKFNAFTYHLLKGFIKVKWFSLPNLLANKSLVPELLQDKVTVGNIVPLIEERLYQDQSQLNQAFVNIHQTLKQNASSKAAAAVIELLSL